MLTLFEIIKQANILYIKALLQWSIWSLCALLKLYYETTFDVIVFILSVQYNCKMYLALKVTYL